MIASIDLSLRSTGVVILGLDGTLQGYRLITPAPAKWNNEDLLIHIAQDIVGFLKDFPITGIVIEGLSFNSFSSEKDKINGNFWHLRCALKEAFPDIPIGIISVSEWRSSVVTKEEQREIKKSTSKDAIKKACVLRLPKTVEEAFSFYIQNQHFPGKCLYDLCDAYFLGKYRVSLET